MKALLLKDFYVITKQMKFFLILIIVFAMIPNTSMVAFATMYAAILPVSAMGYDERCKWNTLACMMPYSAKAIVMSKYVMGYLAVAVAVAAATVGTLVQSIFMGSSVLTTFLPTMLVCVCIALGMLALQMPIMVSKGVEKGRMFLLMTFFLIFFMVIFLSNFAEAANLSALPFWKAAFWLLPFLIAAANVLSIHLSKRSYQKKRG
ncbi:MAG: ABC-2 transporter permease [Oscillospiraceae bacterium]|jgi:ABC-2 type transport system permease protein|nr:ABC-2 transporter permease [Oscillospiraceae bacterium]MDD3260760.1 ABC-2 transporter permease [Oscillospiraceae bacterium]